jgi:DNA-directed RNA polymerase subunit L
MLSKLDTVSKNPKLTLRIMSFFDPQSMAALSETNSKIRNFTNEAFPLDAREKWAEIKNQDPQNKEELRNLAIRLSDPFCLDAAISITHSISNVHFRNETYYQITRKLLDTSETKLKKAHRYIAKYTDKAQKYVAQTVETVGLGLRIVDKMSDPACKRRPLEIISDQLIRSFYLSRIIYGKTGPGLHKIISTIDSISDVQSKDLLYVSICRQFVRDNRYLKEALQIANQISSSPNKDDLLITISQKFMALQKPDEALAAAYKIEHPWKKSISLATVSVLFAQQGHFVKALEIAAQMPIESNRDVVHILIEELQRRAKTCH